MSERVLTLNDKFILYKIDNCPYCTRVIDAIDETGAPYEIRHAQRHPVHHEFLKSLSIQPKLTFPQVFHGDVSNRIGGCEDTIEYLKKFK